MLSIENPPPDPLYYSETSQLKSGSCHNNVCGDETVLSDGVRPQLEVVDLSKSGLNHNSPHFSIRDYVFNTRGKDIANHWPFSPQNLRLCLKHGVNDVLPPFDVVRTPSLLKSLAENVVNNSAVKLSEFGNHRLFVSNNVQKLALDVENIQSSGFEEEKEISSVPSATKSSSCVESVPVIDISCLEAKKVDNLPRSSAEKPEISVISAPNKVEICPQALVKKKCRLIVKLSSIAKPKSNEEFSVNASVVSETMASKVCPVCKTFSSSSNTTLNAHIDQCLSGEPPVKWTANPKTNKHRVKPRKTRLMESIYETSLRCTLEDLDRRNGTNWASNGEVKNDKGTVYLDPNGTKVRILSKSGDCLSNLSGDDLSPWKIAKTDKGSKCITSKKKNRLIHKHKLAKCPSRKRSCFPWQSDSRPKDVNVPEAEFFPEGDGEEMSQLQPLNARDQLVSNDSGKKKQCMDSNRTVPKKNNQKCEKHVVKIAKDLRPNRHSASVSDEFVKRNHDSNSKRKENLALHLSDEHCKEPTPRIREGFSLSSQDCLGKRGRLMLSKCDVLSREDGPLICKQSVHGAGSEAPWSSKKMKSISLIGNDYNPLTRSRRISDHDTISLECEKLGLLTKTTSDRAILSGCKKLTSLRKNVLSVKHAPTRSQLKNSGKRILEFRNHQARVSRSYDEAIASVPAAQGDDWVEISDKSATPKLPIDRAMVLKNQKGRGGSVNTSREGNMGSTGPDTPQECDNYESEKITSFFAGDVPADTSKVPDPVKGVEAVDGFVCEPISRFSYRQEGCSAFGDSLDSKFSGPGVLSGDRPSSQNYVAYEECCEDSFMSLGKQEDSCPELGKGVVTTNTLLVADGDAGEAQRSYSVSVDPIPIPGPPGSFLPSPERMDSEELQGNSSLTTCRVLSFEDERELVDMDASDFSVSATSFVFNSVGARSEHSQGILNNSQGDASEERVDPIVESSMSFNRAGGQIEKQQMNEVQASMVPVMGPCRFENNQSCCCSRKEQTIQNFSLNYHESEPLRSRSITMDFLPSLPSADSDRTDGSTLRLETRPQMELMPETEKSGAKSLKTCVALASTTYHNSEAKLPRNGNCESPSPSTSSSILRLMGKNLMVVNIEENQYPRVGHMQSSLLDNHRILQSSTAITRGNIKSQLNMTSQEVPSTIGNMQTCTVPHHLDLSSLDSSTLPANFRTSESYLYPSRVMFSSKSFGDNLKYWEYADRCNLRTAGTYEAKKVQIPIPQKLVQNATTWNHNLGGSSAFCPDSVTPSSGHHLRPSLYVSPRFSLPH